jgi:sterol 3beta-glucosyltransferase
MHITILTAGSRGDVQPYLPLGRGLLAAGHTVRLATHDIFRELVVQAGLEFALIELNPREMLREAQGQAWLESGHNPIRFLRGLLEVLPPRLGTFLAQSWEVCQGSDAVIYAPLALGGYHIAEKLGVPGLLAALQPSRPTRAYPSPFFPNLPLGPAYNRFTHQFGDALGTLFGGALWKPVNAWRTGTLGLPTIGIQAFQRLHAAHVPVLYGFSPSVVPKPDDWPGWVHVTGYWFHDQPDGWQPPTEVRAFLADGPPPVYLGFGSMSDRNVQATTEIVLEALQRAGRRGIVLAGWGGLRASDLPESVLGIDSIPHDWLFPRVAAVIHHGGAGTTAAGLRAGVPSMAVPFFGDQPFWGARLAELGVGPRPIPKQRLSVERLTDAIRALTADGPLRQHADALGQRIRAENGVAAAVAAFHQHVRDMHQLTRQAA